jgi:hypothetical protein
LNIPNGLIKTDNEFRRVEQIQANKFAFIIYF